MGEALKRDYRIEELLGYGQFGAVCRCISVMTGKPFAVKSINKSNFSGGFNRHMTYEEIKLTSLTASGNPRSIQIHNVYEDDDAIYLILDLCLDSDLFERIFKHDPFYESEAAALIAEIVEAIADCHSRGIVHRDVKPKNILFDSNGNAILADFSCATLFDKGTRKL